MMKWIEIGLWITGLIFLFINYLAFIQAYRLTHFSRKKNNSEKSPYDFSIWEKIALIIFGFNNPRPETKTKPTIPFQQVFLKGYKKIECWLIEPDDSRGMVILFHGYSGEKSRYLERAELFFKRGYGVLLVDFFGSGGSSGSHTTIGFNEAVDVKAAYDFVRDRKPNGKLILFGNSMGAVAIMKAVKDFHLKPNGLVLECPFGSMLGTIGARFKMMGLPKFPLAYLLAFWGGILNGFWPFKHNPMQYAKRINIPVLLLYGEVDKRVSRKEINNILANLNGPKNMVTFPNIGHDDYLVKFKREWEKAVLTFLESVTFLKKEHQI